MKELEGKDVYLIPTGNNARRRDTGFYEKAKIIKVARVNVIFRIDGYQSDDKYRYEGNRLTAGDYNAGYIVFPTKSEMDDYFLAKELAGKIYRKYKFQETWERVGVEKLKQIAELLGL